MMNVLPSMYNLELIKAINPSMRYRDGEDFAAWQKEGCAAEDFAGAARREALRMKEDITKYL